MAELCRLVYRQEADEIGNKAIPPTRNNVLQQVGWNEQAFICTQHIQAMVVAHQSTTAIVFRGTDELRDWLTNINTLPTSWLAGGKVHQGFKKDFETIAQQLTPYITTGLYFTGHSLGGALAQLAASKWVDQAPVTYAFGSPRVGNSDFAEVLNATTYRVINYTDMVTELPPKEWGYAHAGTCYYLSKTGALWENPSDTALKEDREQWKDFMQHIANIGKWDTPIPPLHNHALINYVARLEQLL